MSRTTTNYGWNKFDIESIADITQINPTIDAIDEHMGARLRWIGQWSPNLEVQANDLVTHNGRIWRARLNSGGATPPNADTRWECFADRDTPTISWWGTGWIDLFSINANHGGECSIVMYSFNSGAGNSTGAAVYMIRSGFDGNNFSVVPIAESNAIASFRQQNGMLQISGWDGNKRVRVIRGIV